MKIDLQTVTMGEIFDSANCQAVLQEFASSFEGMDDARNDEFIRNMKFASASMQMKQMIGDDIFNKMVEKLKEVEL